MKEILKQKVGKFFFPIISLIAIIVAGYFFIQLNKLQQSPQIMAQQEVTDLVAKVSKLIVLPTGETPTIATVSDPAALKDQPFFALAQKGDKVLIYAQAKKAVLYSTTLNKIIDVAPLNTGTPKGGVTPADSSITPATSTVPTTPPAKETKTSTTKKK